MIYLQDLLIEQEVLTEQRIMDRIKSLLKNGVTAGVIIATMVGAGLPEVKAQELVQKVQTELIDSLEQVKVYDSAEEFQKDVSNDLDTYLDLSFPRNSLKVIISQKEYTAYGATSQSMQTAIRKATPPGKSSNIRAVVDLSKHNKSGFLAIVLISS